MEPLTLIGIYHVRYRDCHGNTYEHVSMCPELAGFLRSPIVACAAVATAIVFDLTRVADTSHNMTKQIGPKERP